MNVDDCADDACHDLSVCVDGVNSYTCVCVTWGYMGRYCDQDIDECAHDVCLNGATCEDQVNDFYCNCTEGYIGRFCQDDATVVTSTPRPVMSSTPSRPTPTRVPTTPVVLGKERPRDGIVIG